MHIACAAEILQRFDAVGANGDVGEAEAPGAAESVGDDYGDFFLGELAESLSDFFGAGVGVFGKEGDDVLAGDVGLVDAGVGADETVMGFYDQDGMFADDAAGFAEDDFDQSRIFAAAVVVRGGGEIDGALRWSDCGQVDEAVFGFGDDFLGENEDVVLLEGNFGFFGCGEEDAWEVVAGANFGDMRDGEDLE